LTGESAGDTGKEDIVEPKTPFRWEARMPRSIRRPWAVPLLVLCAVPAFLLGQGPTAGGEKPRIDPDLAHHRVLRCWREIRTEEWYKNRKGEWVYSVVEDEGKMCGWSLDPEEVEVWDWMGELSPVRFAGLQIDTRWEPMHLDLITKTDEKNELRVRPGIFRFAGNRLIWVQAPDTEFRASGEYTTRPTSFTPTKTNRCQRLTLVPCKKYGQVQDE
jgi:hypothetical protein